MQPSNSIEMAIWVAVGGRGTPAGRACWAPGSSTAAKSWLTVAFPSAWLYCLGALFILVTLFLPHGLVGLRAPSCAACRQVVARLTRRPVTGDMSAEAATPRPRPGRRTPHRHRHRSPPPRRVADPATPSPPATPPRPSLWVDDVTVSFDGFKALNDLSLTLEKGELRCIIGPNGAGKTTLMDVITGKTRPDNGGVLRSTGDEHRPDQAVRVRDRPSWASGASSSARRCSRATPSARTWSWRCAGSKGVWRSLFGGWTPAERDAHRGGPGD